MTDIASIISIISIVSGNFENVEKAVVPLVALSRRTPLFIIKGEYSEADLKTCNLMVSTFMRAIEIITNIFFRAVEYAVKGDMSPAIGDCLETICSAKLIEDCSLWLAMTKVGTPGDGNRLPVNKIADCNKIIADYTPEIERLLERARGYIARLS